MHWRIMARLRLESTRQPHSSRRPHEIGQTGVVPDAVGSHPQYDEFVDEYLDHAREQSV